MYLTDTNVIFHIEASALLKALLIFDLMCMSVNELDTAFLCIA